MINFKNKAEYGFEDLLRIMDILRGEGGCPWDREQTHESIRKNFIEEVYEACEAIDLKDNTLLCEELGDVLLQVVFHADMAEDEGAFDINDVCDGVCRKLILRHPHIFGDTKAGTSAEVLDNWEAIKRIEKGQKTYSDSIRQVAKSLPALMYAEKVQKKAKKAGFDWPDISGALDKIDEEKAEYVMLPVWMLNYRYKDKTYQFALNGQTGKQVGTLPLSKGRMAGFFGGLTAGIWILLTLSLIIGGVV